MGKVASGATAVVRLLIRHVSHYKVMVAHAPTDDLQNGFNSPLTLVPYVPARVVPYVLSLERDTFQNSLKVVALPNFPKEKLHLGVIFVPTLQDEGYAFGLDRSANLDANKSANWIARESCLAWKEILSRTPSRLWRCRTSRKRSFTSELFLCPRSKMKDMPSAWIAARTGGSSR